MLLTGNNSSIDPYGDLRRTYQNVEHWFRKLLRERNYEGGNFQFPSTASLVIFGVTDLGRGNKFLGLVFPQENEKCPYLPALLFTQNPPSFRLLVYVELPNLRIKAQSPKIKILNVKMEHAHLQFWLSTK